MDIQNATFVSWDFDLDVNKLNVALSKCRRPVVFKVNNNSGVDSVVVCEHGTTYKQAQAFADSLSREECI